MRFRGLAGLSPTVVAAFAVVYIVWGSTYLGNIVAIETIPPFVLIAGRLLVAGAVLLGFAFAKTRFLAARSRQKGAAAPSWVWPTSKEWRNLTVTAFLFLTVGLGAVVWAEQYIDSGVTALIVALEPLAVVLVLWAFDGKRPRWQAFAGVGLGMLGMALLVGQDVVLEGEHIWWGIGAILVGILAWAFGSVFTARLRLPEDRLSTAAYQMLLAGALALPIALLMGDFDGFTLAQISKRSIWAYAFLVVFGSIIGYTAFLYLLKEVSPEKVATSSYVHPVVALTLGVLIRGEVVTVQTGLACLVLLGGVVLVNVEWGSKRTGGVVDPVIQPRQANGRPILRRWRRRARPIIDLDLADIKDVVLPEVRKEESPSDARIKHDVDTISQVGV